MGGALIPSNQLLLRTGYDRYEARYEGSYRYVGSPRMTSVDEV